MAVQGGKANVIKKLMSILVKLRTFLHDVVHFRQEIRLLENLLTWPLKTPFWFSPSNNRCLYCFWAIYSPLCLARLTQPVLNLAAKIVSWVSRSNLSVVGDELPYVSCQDIYTRST